MKFKLAYRFTAGLISNMVLYLHSLTFDFVLKKRLDFNFHPVYAIQKLQSVKMKKIEKETRHLNRKKSLMQRGAVCDDNKYPNSRNRIFSIFPFQSFSVGSG